MNKELKQLGIHKLNDGAFTGTKWKKTGGEKMVSFSPVDGKEIAAVTAVNRKHYDAVISEAQTAFEEWRMWPAPKRGEVVRQVGDALREHKQALGKLVSYEMGKSLQEGLGGTGDDRYS